MSSEVEWRRRWKPTLNAVPWQPLKVDGTVYLIKYKFSTDAYEILVTDFTHFWYEELSQNALKKRVKKLNPGIEAPLTRILDQIKSCLDKTQEDAKTSLKLSYKPDSESGECSVAMAIESTLAGMPFTWSFLCRPAETRMGSEHLVVPLLAMVCELSRRQQELTKVVQSKDREIEDLKAQGAKPSRKHIETPKFVETAFEMNMMTSKDFENHMKSCETDAFDVRGQDLYRQVVSKRAWINRSPTKAGAGEDESLLDDMSSAEGAGPAKGRGSMGGSWGNSRLPPSLQQSRSPNKSPTKTPSPAKTLRCYAVQPWREGWKRKKLSMLGRLARRRKSLSDWMKFGLVRISI
ncbi:NHEJ1-like protein [Mya arenaria]|uniref:Non-homologous end-joining factor 1 n=1 Tax=Mya arenaria TaxID=6604 RepID=A0ABY7E6S4_MYAAR|nr:NHEJ1-like protein [Mya arenaria]